MSFAAGTRFGIYEVSGLIGVGGMGEVYRATDTTLGRDVALKVLPESFGADAERVARFEREARTLASLNHANIAHIYGLERREAATALVMELVDGVTLDERVARGPLPPSEALAIAIEIASALEAAHEQGIVHRDLKPANIKIKRDGAIKVLDFGIAKVLDGHARSAAGPQTAMASGMTEVGVVLGTPPYMSPEQARGSAVDKRADIWAFGCVLYEMLTGRAAFLGDDAASTLARVLEREPDMRLLPAEIPSAVRRTLELCLQKSLKERARDIGDVRLALEGKFSVPAPPSPKIWRRALPAAAALLVGALTAGAYVTTLVPSTSATPAPPVTRFVITPPASAPLSSLGGHDFTISPDGRRLAYLGRNAATNGVELYVREIDALEPRLLLGTEVLNPWPNVNPFFSPDGRSIGFAAPDGNVMRVRLDGTPPVKMFQSNLIFGASWITDDAVVFSRGTHLERVATDGTGVREAVTPETAADVFLASPAALPGGRAVLFMSRAGANGAPRVAALDLETGRQKILFEGGQKPLYASTGHIVFARGSTLMAVAFDASELALTGEPVPMLDDLRAPANGAPDYALSETGTLAYVAADEQASGSAALVFVDRAGAVVGRAVSESLDQPHDPRLSPDGTRVVVTTGPLSSGQVWIYDVNGRPPIPLALDEGGGLPVWSPDGREIAFIFFTLPGWPLHTAPSDGNAAPQPLTAAGTGGFPSDWSSAGEVLFASPVDVRAARIDGGAVRDVIATGSNEFDAAVAPNGRWLAYVSDRTGQPEVWVQSYLGGGAVRVSANGGYEPRWSPDGTELFFLQGGSMYAVSLGSENELSPAAPVLLFSGNFLTDPGPGARTYDVARDGRFLMIQREAAAQADDAPASIVVVQNWFEELKRRVPTN